MVKESVRYFDPDWYDVLPLDSRLARDTVEREHYLHRKPTVSFAYGLFDGRKLVGVVIFGTPPSRHLQVSACPSDPALVLELNRLWVDDSEGKNAESWFVSRALSALPPRIVVSYADTAHQHAGYVYRALNFDYAGWTDMDRKSPRVDYVTDGKHSRATFRSGAGAKAVRVPRKPKARYWTVTGDRRQKKAMRAVCAWPSLSWKEKPVPFEDGFDA